MRVATLECLLEGSRRRILFDSYPPGTLRSVALAPPAHSGSWPRHPASPEVSERELVRGFRLLHRTRSRVPGPIVMSYNPARRNSDEDLFLRGFAGGKSCAHSGQRRIQAQPPVKLRPSARNASVDPL